MSKDNADQANEHDLADAPVISSNASAQFAEQSYLTYCVPTQTELDLEETFADASSAKTLLEQLEQRESLFFGENTCLQPSFVEKPGKD